MPPEQTETLTSRRAWLARVGAAGALGAVAPAAFASAANAAEADAGAAGEVVGTAAGGGLTVRLDADGRTVTGQAQGDRALRAGDRVVFHGDGGVFPLYFGVEGPINARSGGAVSVAGIECRMDGRSAIYRAGGSDVAARSAPPSRDLSPGTRVSLLCVENRLDGTRTVDAVYLS